MNVRVNDVKEFLRNNIGDALCDIFFTRNTTGDMMTRIYNHGGVQIDISYKYRYFEVFGLTEDECAEVETYYNDLVNGRSNEDKIKDLQKKIEELEKHYDDKKN